MKTQMKSSSALDLANEHERSGRFSKALQTLESGSTTPLEKRAADVLRAQLLERTGKYPQSRSLLNGLLKSRDLTHRDRSICELVAARLDWDSAKIDAAVAHLQRSIDEARQANDLERMCWSQLRLLGMLRDKCGVDAASALLAELRANATKLGDARVLSALHIFVGQMEAQRGLFSSARYHTRVGLGMLAAAPNLWLEATAENVNFGISVLLLNVDAGLAQGRKALKLAEESGAASTVGTSLGNLGNLYYALGQFDEAIEYHQRALALVSTGGENWNGSLESLAQISLAQGRIGECQALLDEIDRAAITDSDTRRYVYRHARLTRARLLAHLGRQAEALQVAESVLKLANESNDHLLANRAQLTHAQLLLETDRAEASFTILNAIAGDLPRLPAELHASYERILGKALYLTGRMETAERHFERAERICNALRNIPGLIELSKTRQECSLLNNDRTEASAISEQTTERNILQTAATLLVHHDRPEILAGEVVNLLAETGVVTCATAQRQTASGETQILARFGRGATAEHAEVIEKRFQVGIVDECRMEVVAYCKPDIESTATLNAIALLLHTIHDLERARAEREERATLWPIDELPSDNTSAVLTGHMRELIGLARRIGPTNVTVLITGESGTGKEILARAIHAFSSRAAKPLIPFNCASIPREMLESQLFGHRRGAFTGADRDQPGVIRAARDGTLFLDEIGEMGLDLQPKLLRFLESGEISPLGEPSPLTVNVRVVAATNANLDTLVREGRFREDLFYRINVFRLAIRPLRERRDEIPSLVNAFVARAAAEFRKGHIRVAEETMEHLLLYPWPGNVRQLLNEVRRMVALAEPNSTLAPAHISSEIRAVLPAFPTFNADTRQIAVRLRDKLTPTLSKIECEMIRLALRDNGGKVDAAARALGISRKGLYLKRQRLGL